MDWDEVEEYMHMEHTLESGNDDEMDIMEVTLPKRRHSSIELTQEELDAIYVRTPDPKKDRSTGPVTVRAKEKTREPGSAYQDPKWEARRRAKAGTEEYLLVDGYNIIFSWEELKELSERDIGAARGKLADILSNYQGFRKCTLILVFDAYKVEGNPGEVLKYHNINITKKLVSSLKINTFLFPNGFLPSVLQFPHQDNPEDNFSDLPACPDALL